MFKAVCQNCRGMTLIEVMAALVVFSIAALGTLALFPVSIDASKKAADLTECKFIAQELMEEYRKADFSSVSSDSLTPYSGNTYYSYSSIVTDVITGALKRVSLNITWQRKGTQYTQTFTTYIANNG